MSRTKYKNIKYDDKCIRVIYGADYSEVESLFNILTDSYTHFKFEKNSVKQKNFNSLVKEMFLNDRIAIVFFGLNFEKLLQQLIENISKTNWNGKIIISLSLNPNYDKLLLTRDFERYCSIHEVPLLSINEIIKERPISPFDYDNLILSGGISEIWKKGLVPFNYYEKKTEEIILSNIRRNFILHNYTGVLELLRNVVRRLGQPTNVSELCEEIKVDVKTLNNWLLILNQLNLIYFVKPINFKFRARVVKSYKIYFKDTSLACYLAGIKNVNDLNSSALKSALFENLVINEVSREFPYLSSETYKIYHNNRFHIEFYKEHGWLEIKMFLSCHQGISNSSNCLTLITDIKMSQGFNPELARNLTKFTKNLSALEQNKSFPILQNYNEKKYLIYAGKDVLEYDDFHFIPLHRLWLAESSFSVFFNKVKFNGYSKSN